MAEKVMVNPYVLIGTSAAPDNLTDHVRAVTLNYTIELQDRTASGSTFRRRIAGLKDWTATVEFNQDFAADEVDATLWGLVGSTANRMVIKPSTAVVGAGNPRFSGNAMLESYQPLGGSVGDLMTVSITFQGNGTLTRSTAST